MSPTLYLTNVASLKSPGHAGEGMVLHAMARPPAFVTQVCEDMSVPDLAPDPEENAWIMARLKSGELTAQDVADYKASTVQRFWARRNRYPTGRGWGPAGLTYKVGAIPDHTYWVGDGDTIVCTCPRIGSPKRTHECHLEWAAPMLVTSGWRVVLYGQRFDLRKSA